jgi:integrase
VCEPCEQNRIELRAQDFANLNFADAAVRWLEDRKAFIRPKTYHEYKLCIGNLNKFFGQLRLIAIHIGMLLSYQQERMEVVGPSSINHDLCVMQQVLKRADLWKHIQDLYRPLPLPRWTKPKVMSHEEEERLFRIAATNENWSVAYWACILSNNTSATGCELRAIQVKHIHIDTVPPFIEISADPVKNEFRGRTIPLNPEALGAIKWLLKRLRGLGGGQFDDYLFPFRVKRNCYALNRPASPQFIRSAFNGMRAAADLPWLTPHCLRHQIITKMLEQGAPEETVRAIAGHVSRQMMLHYSHLRIQAKAEVLNSLAGYSQKRRKA